MLTRHKKYSEVDLIYKVSSLYLFILLDISNRINSN